MMSVEAGENIFTLNDSSISRVQDLLHIHLVIRRSCFSENASAPPFTLSRLFFFNFLLIYLFLIWVTIMIACLLFHV